MRGATATLILAVLLLAGVSRPVAPGDPPSVPPSPPTFRADTQVVLLDLVARDGKGRPVADLRQDEVQVLEDGRRCEIQSFKLVRAAGTTRDPAAAAGPLPAGSGPSDREPATPSRANLVVLLFDRLLVGTAPYAQQGALALLDQPFPANTWFAVFKVYTRGTQVLQPFTNDPGRLTAAVIAATTGDDAKGRTVEAPSGAVQLQSVAPGPQAGAAGPSRTPPDAPPLPAGPLDTLSSQVQANLSELSQRVQTFDTLYGLLAIARGLEPVRGRKSIVYFAEGREVPDSTTVAYDTTISEANRANVTIHTVDTRGLTATRLGGHSAFDELIDTFSAQAKTRTPREDGRPKTVTPEGAVELQPLSGSILDHIASDTGGLAIANTNDLGAGLARVAEELGEYYEVVYAPPNPVPDGRFRRIEAKVTRPGVRVRTRAGYFATPATTPAVLAYELPLTAAIASNAAPHDFTHTAGVLHFRVEGRERESVFLARVPLSEIVTMADDARGVYRAHLQLLGFVKDEAGRAVARFSHDWPIEGPLRDRGRLGQASAIFRRTLTLPPGRYTVETAVQDAESRHLSVERSTVDIPPAADGLALGSLSVVRRAAPAQGAAGTDPLRVSSVSIEPELGTPVLAASVSEVPLFLPVYGAAAGAEMELELWRGGERVARTKPRLPVPEPDGRIAWIGGLTAKSLSLGRYEAVARVRQDGQAAEERVSFEIRSSGALARAAGLPDAGTAPAGPPPVPPDLVPVLERAGQYVLDYEEKFQNIVAEESYTQWTTPLQTTATALTVSCAATSCKRTTRADVVFVRLAGAIPWGCFRDVYESDGTKVREHESRLETLFTSVPSATAQQRARIILDDSARYNIGPALRNINFPTLSLLFLHPGNRSRFAWKRGGKRWFGKTETVELDFEEIARPTLVDQGGKGDLPARGRFWVDPARGTVARAEVTFRFEPARARAYVATEYVPDAKLALWVPSEMREEYDDLPGAMPRLFGTPSEATARYSNFRRFSVSIDDEQATLPKE